MFTKRLSGRIVFRDNSSMEVEWISSGKILLSTDNEKFIARYEESADSRVIHFGIAHMCFPGGYETAILAFIAATGGPKRVKRT
jgi:hypothetical protein